MKHFTPQDIVIGGYFPHIYTEPADLVERPLWHHKRGLSQTASGYGAKLASSRMIHFAGKLRRIYVTIYSNAGTAWFQTKAHGKIAVS
jgi:hypothetical protein